MKTKIFYFTASGNSLVAARDIALRLGGCELIPIAKVIDKELDLSADRIGIVFPVFIWGLPSIVADFLKKFKNVKNKYIFTLATYGGWPAATTLQAKKILKTKGTRLSAGFALRMPGNYTPFYGAESDERQKRVFDKAAKKLNMITEQIKTGKSIFEKNDPITNIFFSGIFYNMASPYFHKMDSNYFADDKCDGCSVCAKVCPVSNIKMESGKPVWLHKCEHCLACLHWCPKEAVQAGKKTTGRKRYHHPGIKLKDLLDQSRSE